MKLIGQGTDYADEICKMFEDSNLFDSFSPDELKIFAQYAEVYDLERGATLFNEGDISERMYLIVRGKVDVYKQNDAYKNKKITTIHAGKTIGEMSIIDGLPCSATAITAEPSRLVLISKENFLQFTKNHPVQCLKLTLKISKLLSLRLRRATNIIADYLD